MCVRACLYTCRMFLLDMFVEVGMRDRLARGAAIYLFVRVLGHPIAIVH